MYIMYIYTYIIYTYLYLQSISFQLQVDTNSIKWQGMPVTSRPSSVDELGSNYFSWKIYVKIQSWYSPTTRGLLINCVNYFLSRELTYSTWGKGKSSTQKCRLVGDMLVPKKVFQNTSGIVSWFLRLVKSCHGIQSSSPVLFLKPMESLHMIGKKTPQTDRVEHVPPDLFSFRWFIYQIKNNK